MTNVKMGKKELNEMELNYVNGGLSPLIKQRYEEELKRRRNEELEHNGLTNAEG